MNFRRLIFERLKSIAGTAAAVLLARLLSFGIFVFAARNMTQEGNAGLIYVVGMSQLIVQLGSLGWLNLIRRMAARIDSEPPELAKGFLLRSLQVPCFSVGAIGAALLIASSSGALDAAFSATLFWTAVVALAMVINYILREYLAGLNHPTLSVLCSETLPFAATVAGLFALPSPDLASACECLVASLIISTAVQFWIVQPKLKKLVDCDEAAFRTSAWTKIAALTGVGFGGKLLMDRIDTLLLVPIAGLDQLVYLNSATRLSALLLLVPVILIPVFAPRVSRAFHANDLKQLRFEMLLQIALIGLTVFPAAMFLQLNPGGLIAAIFGEKYVRAGDIMWLIVSAQSLFAIAPPFSNLLVMTNGEMAYASASLTGFAISLLAGLILIPLYSVWGAALASLFATGSLATILIVAGCRILQWRRGPALKASNVP